MSDLSIEYLLATIEAMRTAPQPKAVLVISGQVADFLAAATGEDREVILCDLDCLADSMGLATPVEIVVVP